MTPRHAAVEPTAGVSNRERRLVAALTALLTSATPVLAVVWILLLPVPYLLGWGNFSTVTIPVLPLLLALGLARTEPGVDRRVFMSLYLVGYLLRFGAVVLIAGATGHPPLGPDSTTYLRQSQSLAANHLVTAVNPTAFNGLGTFDVAHYYLFAVFIMLFGGDLVGLQLLNGGLAALVAPLVFSWCRRVAGRYAVVVGALLAVHPSLIVLASIDLLKDPSVMFFAALVLWAAVRFEHRQSRVTAVAFFLSAVAGLTYLRMDRFYLLAFAESAVLISAVLFLRHATSKLQMIRRSLPIILLFLVVEAGPIAVGWPPSAVLVYRNIEQILSGQPGLVGRVSDSVPDSAMVEARSGGAGLAAMTAPFPLSTNTSTTPAAGAHGAGQNWTNTLVALAVDAFRRFFGPYVWVPPERWELESILRSNFPLYPGMIIWYAALPLFAIGVGLVVVRAVRGLEHRASLVVLAIFLVLYFLQYFVLDLSYRQRDTMLPFLAIFGAVGFYALLRSRRWLWAYRLYWIGLLLIAAGHTLFRATHGGA